MSFGKQIVRGEAFQTAIAFLAALLIKFVRRTSRFEVRRGDIAARFWTGDEPFIGATWH